ncbi:hypothetical protein V8V91_14850 [Algoriphagus halophilus]|uniref:hypothetical protein n=1 Tax=Algoriphagus halophilus TaxID=226505 RepID=UPI00358F2A19
METKSKKEYINDNPAWEILLDLDEMSKSDSIPWVFKGATGLYPDYSRFIVNLSKGGGDATVKREFDVNSKNFLDNGFYVPESKGSVSYLDKNTLIISSDFGENSMTTAGYPRQVKQWKRGTSLKDATLLFEGNKEDILASGFVFRNDETKYKAVVRVASASDISYLISVDDKQIKLDIPSDASPQNLLNNQLIVLLKSDWSVGDKTYKHGSLLSLNFTKLLEGEKEIQLILEPTESSSISGVSTTKNKLLITLLHNVSSELFIYTFENNKWISEKVNAPDFGTISVQGVSDLSDEYFFHLETF